MLVFQAFPFSLSVLWRYIVVLPVLLVALVVYGLIGGILSALIGLIIPGLSVLISFFVGASSGVIPMLVGSRLGLQAYEVSPSISYRKFVLPAVVYGVVEAIGISIAAALIAALTIGAVSAGGVPDDPAAFFATLTPMHIMMLSGVVILLFAAICALRAGFLVPIAAASIGRDPNGRPYTPFNHFGAFFLQLFAVVAISFVGAVFFFALFLVGLTAIYGPSTLVGDVQLIGEMLAGTAPFSVTAPMIATVVAYVLLASWAFSYQCAGGVLAYLRLSGGAVRKAPSTETLIQPTPQPTTSSGPKMSSEELRALRKSREFR